ncbi:MAG: PaaI family thioesterase [Acidimicrobiales bacterium]
MSGVPSEQEARFYSMPFTRTLGIELVSASPEAVVARLAWSEERCTTAGVMHGGALMALADSVGGMCAFANLPADASGTTTVESKTNFVRAVRSDHVEATSRPLHVGRTVIVVETELRDAAGKLAAKVTQSQLVLRA